MTSDKKNKKNRLRKIAGYIFPFILTIIFLWLAFRDVDIEKALGYFSRISVGWFLLFLVVFMLSHYLRALRWKYIINSVKPDNSIWNLFGALMIGYGVNCIVPRLGELYRALFLGRWENVSRTTTLGTIIVERVIDLLALLIAVFISVMIYTGDLYTDITWLRSTLYIGGVVIFAMIVFLVLLVKLQDKFYNGIVKLAGKISDKLAEKLSYVFRMLVSGFASLKGSKNFTMTLILSALIMIVYALNALMGFYMLRMHEIHEVTFGMAWVLMTISAFGIIIPTPGGVGSYHAINILVLTTLFGFAIEISAAYALLTNLISVVIFILSTVISVYLVNIRHKKLGGEGENFISVFKIRSDEK